MLRKCVLVAVLATSVSCLIAQNSDSLVVKERNDMLFQYLDFKNGIDAPDGSTWPQIMQKAEELINKDNALVDTLKTRDYELAVAKADADSVKSQLAESQSKVEEFEGMKNIVMYAGGGGALLILILLIVVIVMAASRGSAKKKMAKKNQELIDEAESVKAEAEAALAKAAEKDSLITKAVKEKEAAEINAKDLQTALNTANTKNTQSSLEFEKQLKEVKASESSLLQEKLRLSAFEAKVKPLEEKIRQLEEKLKESESKAMSARSLELQLSEEKIKSESLEIKLKNLEEKLHETEEKYIGAEPHFNEASEDQLQAIENYQRTITELEGKISDYEEVINQVRDRSEKDDDFYKKVNDVELRVIKLEKLDRLLDRQVISQEEYDGIKNRLLSDF